MARRRWRVLPPHTRGWTRSPSAPAAQHAASPAHAGMDPPGASSRPCPRRFPRTRGDGPGPLPLSQSRAPLPPHTRGWTREGRAVPRHAAASPAHAGMDPAGCGSWSASACFPRTRGDGPSVGEVGSLVSVLPPHTRGWTWAVFDPDAMPPASPAHAGMDPPRASSGRSWTRFPRTRGDGPNADLASLSAKTLPPHTRGWTRHGLPPGVASDASPAHAGMDRGRSWGDLCFRGFPRTRGDGPSSSSDAFPSPALPPHTRGWTRWISGRRLSRWASPAHAGMDRSSSTSGPCSPRFPRTRGDGPIGQSRRGLPRRLPPHTRGWTLALLAGRVDEGASPAHAGMDPGPFPSGSWCPRFPRTRGDGPAHRAHRGHPAGLPPHTRGWTLAGEGDVHQDRASPAHAGMDPKVSSLVLYFTRFPRTRGDGPKPNTSTRTSNGLPPHTRGWTETASSRPAWTHASPAHAGMDPPAESG